MSGSKKGSSIGNKGKEAGKPAKSAKTNKHNAAKPKVHAESDERKTEIKNRIEIKRLYNQMTKLKEELEEEEAGPKVDVDKYLKTNPQFHLKGAARAALEHYLPKEVMAPIKVALPALLWDRQKGPQYLQSMLCYAQSLQYLSSKPSDCVKVYQEMVELDPVDHLNAREGLAAFYLSKQNHVKAEEILSKAPNNTFTAYSKALMQYAKEDSETGQSMDRLVEATQINPIAIWLLTYPDIFEKHLGEDSGDEEYTGTDTFMLHLTEAADYFEDQGELWEQYNEALKEHTMNAELAPPLPPSTLSTETLSEAMKNCLNGYSQAVKELENQLVGG